MKKILLSLSLAAVLFIHSNAQLFVGGRFNFDTHSESFKSSGTTNDGDSWTDFGIKPKVGFFLNDNFAVGASIGFDMYSKKTPATNPNGNDRTYSENTFTIAPFVRYYFLEMGQVGVFGEAELGLGFGGSTNKVGSTSTDGPSIFELSISLMPGVSYKITDNIDIEASIGAIMFKNRNENDEVNKFETSTTDFNFDLSTGLALGFIYKF